MEKDIFKPLIRGEDSLRRDCRGIWIAGLPAVLITFLRSYIFGGLLFLIFICWGMLTLLFSPACLSLPASETFALRY